jgi:hypothetical protein
MESLFLAWVIADRLTPSAAASWVWEVIPVALKTLCKKDSNFLTVMAVTEFDLVCLSY